MTAPRIDRANLVRCIACRAWVAPNQRLRAAFRGGHDVRFYVCLTCLEEYKASFVCQGCGGTITAETAHLKRLKGRVVMTERRHLKCRYTLQKNNQGYRLKGVK